jgi:hypothetical protein
VILPRRNYSAKEACFPNFFVDIMQTEKQRMNNISLRENVGGKCGNYAQLENTPMQIF